MNILIEGGDLNPPFAEGTRNIVINHAKALINRRHKVIILTRRKSRISKERLLKIEKIEGITFYRWSNYLNLLYLYKKIIEKEKIDIVHFFAKGVRPNIYFKLIKFFKRKPLIFSLLGLPQYSSNVNKDKKKILSSLKEVNISVVSSKTILKEFEGELKNLIYLPYGIDLTNFKETKDKKKFILFLRKPTLAALNAFKKLKKEFPKFKFIFNSATISNEDLPFMTELKKQFICLKNNEEMTKIYNQTKILIDLHNPSNFLECASPPAAILEAISCGAIIISTKMPEIEDIIINKKTGFLINNNSEEEIYETVKKALISKENSIKKNAKNMVKKIFDISKVILEYENIYKKLIGKN